MQSPDHDFREQKCHPWGGAKGRGGREREKDANSGQEIGRHQVAVGLVIQDEAWHIVSVQLINYGSVTGN